jgi:hypothetical protein
MARPAPAGPTTEWGIPFTFCSPDTADERVMESAARRKLGDIFVERGLITPAQLEDALAEQRQSGGRLGEILVERGFVTRVALAGVITEQWDELRVTERAQKTAQVQARQARTAVSPSSVVELALRERLEAMQTEIAAKDARIAQQDATIAALLSRVADLERPSAA